MQCDLDLAEQKFKEAQAMIVDSKEQRKLKDGLIRHWRDIWKITKSNMELDKIARDYLLK